MTGRVHRQWVMAMAAVVAALCLLAACTTVPLSAVVHQSQLTTSAQVVPEAVVFGIVGFLVVRRPPRNPMALSWRHSSGERRQQLKCLLAGAATLALAQAILQPVLSFAHLDAVAQGVLHVISGLGFGALPTAVGVAILKYRRYDIDRIISRTLAYTFVTGLLAGLYAGLVLLATQVLTLTSQVAVAAATLAAAALFNPVRRRVQHVVDRRFNRARYDADNSVASFAARLQDTTDSDAVRSDLIGTVHVALEPAPVALWLTGAQ